MPMCIGILDSVNRGLTRNATGLTNWIGVSEAGGRWRDSPVSPTRLLHNGTFSCIASGILLSCQTTPNMQFSP
ncbi:hypothetical protein K227x_53330 [Rubripirellula lacrimiformis]|uniref:Uncharacterized protein n=1 Tax=Rubripirellula lacrimiformis TaxID=1930273 RepID=A0A517NIF0_9BACT|nr:hypothetical protein K227x_53330 [Rubripirellula lacrimiformis]